MTPEQQERALALLTAAQWGSCDGCRTVRPTDKDERKFGHCIFCTERHQEGDVDYDAPGRPYTVITLPHRRECPLGILLAELR